MKIFLGGPLGVGAQGLEVDVDFSKPSRCKGCGQTIYWCKTEGGKSMPVIIQSHFADCPKADEFRNKKKVESG
jgi:hypothetical protein